MKRFSRWPVEARAGVYSVAVFSVFMGVLACDPRGNSIEVPNPRHRPQPVQLCDTSLFQDVKLNVCWAVYSSERHGTPAPEDKWYKNDPRASVVVMIDCKVMEQCEKQGE